MEWKINYKDRVAVSENLNFMIKELYGLSNFNSSVVGFFKTESGRDFGLTIFSISDDLKKNIRAKDITELVAMVGDGFSEVGWDIARETEFNDV